MLVEFAIALVPLLLILVGMLQFGISLNAKIDEQHIATTGARYAAVDQNPGDGVTLQDYLLGQADTDHLRTNGKVCIEYLANPETGTSMEVGDPVRVTMSYSYDLLPLLGDRVGVATLDIEGDATMRLEAAPNDVTAGCST